MNTRIFALSLLLGGCITSVNQANHSIVSGVPGLMSTYYSATQVTANKAVATAHGISAVRGRYDAALMEIAGIAPKFARPVLGETVKVYGTGMAGQPLVVDTVVMDERMWACDGPRIPEIHTENGPCTMEGRGYSFGFAVAQEGIASGFSGGGAYNSKNQLLGIVVQVGRDNRGRDIAFLYFIDDLRKDLKF